MPVSQDVALTTIPQYWLHKSYLKKTQEIKKIIPFTVASKKIKNLNQGVKITWSRDHQPGDQDNAK